MDESTHIRETAQLLVLIRMIFEDISVKEEVLGMLYLKGKLQIMKYLIISVLFQKV
jgi:hypothetical protein